MSRHIFAEYLLSRARTESVSVQNWGGNQRSAFHRPASNSGQSPPGPIAVGPKCARFRIQHLDLLVPNSKINLCQIGSLLKTCLC